MVQFALLGVLFVLPFLTRPWAGWSAPWQMIGWVMGVVLLGVGGVLALAGVMNLGSNLTAVPHPKDDATMVEHGAYRLVRHPIYSGIILGAFGWGFLMNSLVTLVVAVILFLFFDMKSRREEQWLCEKYANYSSYQKRVRKLIPFVY
jgi:protein-S-isoprenylcysteine O-methyltransferase Ste14